MAIETRDLTKRYGDRAVVDRLNLSVPDGTVFGFLGPNGAGKTTTVRMLCGALRWTSGAAVVAGLSPARDLERLKRVIGFMPQQFGLYDYLTVAENVAFYANLYLPTFREARTRTREVIAATGLDDYARYETTKLSGGWRQRLALACAIIHRPRVLFLDEPTAGVDPISRGLFWDLLHGLNEVGVTVFVTTHYMEEVERCHLVGLISDGRLAASGRPRELKLAVGDTHEFVAVRAAEPERAFAMLRAIPDLVDAHAFGDEIHLAWPRGTDGVARTRAAFEQAGLAVFLVERRASTMEDVFVHAVTAGAAAATGCGR